jgi:hypothetical protein
LSWGAREICPLRLLRDASDGFISAEDVSLLLSCEFYEVGAGGDLDEAAGDGPERAAGLGRARNNMSRVESPLHLAERADAIVSVRAVVAGADVISIGRLAVGQLVAKLKARAPPSSTPALDVFEIAHALL